MIMNEFYKMLKDMYDSKGLRRIWKKIIKDNERVVSVMKSRIEDTKEENRSTVERLVVR